jgi:hypothetical protein
MEGYVSDMGFEIVIKLLRKVFVQTRGGRKIHSEKKSHPLMRKSPYESDTLE